LDRTPKPGSFLMKFLKILLAVSVLIVILLAGWALALRYLPPQWFYSREIGHCEQMVLMVESYKKDHGRYPPNTDYSHNGIQDDEGVYFYRQEGDRYRVGFSVGFDGHYEYDSMRGKWSYEK